MGFIYGSVWKLYELPWFVKVIRFCLSINSLIFLFLPPTGGTYYLVMMVLMVHLVL